MAFDAGAAVGHVILNSDKWVAGTETAIKANKQFNQSFEKTKKAALATSAVITTAFVGSAKAAVDFGKSMSNVSTLVDTTQVDMQVMSKELLQLDNRLGSATDLTGGLYQALSASVEPAKAVQFVGEAAQFARAALVDTNTAVDVITTGLNAYGLEADRATEISDKLFSVIRLGKTTGAELSAVIGQTIPLAANMGIAFDEVGAAVAVMTRQGVKAAEATTQINAVINSFLKPSSEMEEVIKNIGFESASMAIEQIGLKRTIDAVIRSTDGSKESMAGLFANTRALRGALALTGEGAADFEEILGEITNSAGATNEAFEKQDLTFETLSNSVNKLAIQAGEILLPAIMDIVESVSGWFEKISQLDDQTKKNIVNIGLFVAAIGPGLAIIQKLVLAYKVILPLMLAAKAGFTGQALAAGASTAATIAHSAAVKVAAIAQKAWNIALAASPIGLAVIGIAAVTTAVVGLGHKMKKTNEEIRNMGLAAQNTQDQVKLLGEQTVSAEKSVSKFMTTLHAGSVILDAVFDPANIDESVNGLKNRISTIDKETKAIEKQIAAVKRRGKQRIFFNAEQDKRDADELKALSDELNGRIRLRKKLVEDLANAEKLRAEQKKAADEQEKERLIKIEEEKKVATEQEKIRAEAERFERENVAAQEERLRIEAEQAEITKAQKIEELTKAQKIRELELSEAVAARKAELDEQEIERKKMLREEYEKTANALITTFGPVLGDLGSALAGAEGGWENLKKSALNAVASLVEGLALQWALQSAAAFATANIPVGIGLAAASAAAYTGAGFIRGLKDGGVASGLTLVGEEGPELINVGTPSRVFPADETANMLGKEVNVKITNIINTDTDIELMNRRLGRVIQENARKVI